jgi:prepilin-type N-terminal cleavage/methylation domain-containing protein
MNHKKSTRKLESLNFYKTSGGFTLIETLIALAIMAALSLMAWQGLDAVIRGKEVIENQQAKNSLRIDWVRQFEMDCQNILSHQQFDLGAAEAGIDSHWLLRNQSDTLGNYLEIVGYVRNSNGLTRWVSPAYRQKREALNTWVGISRDLNTPPGNFSNSNQWSEVNKQDVFIHQEVVKPGKLIRGISISWFLNKHTHPIQKICLVGPN